jgi:hypothetical protein
MQHEIHHMSYIYAIQAILCIAWLITGCVVPELRVTDMHGCVQPPSATFRKAGVDASLAQSTFGKVITGELKLSAQPEVISLISAVAQEEDLRAYHRCLAIRRDHFSLEQATYLEQMYLFVRTHPTAEQFQKWQA